MLPQIGSCLFVTWGILWSFPETRTYILVSSLVISWSITEEAAKKHHHLDLNTLRGHTDCVTALDFSSDACNLTTGEPTLSLPFDQDLSCLRTETF
ncbi:very-long-chain (3R)-3-hydroxyacyl-CoA dehydratase PASTICCINO 2 [Hordeum vulgare]|nr:very-long-chain (3R)-3-hydroxyacyl-CoA dehydratase PASTICCINO 2 [Hordeum vulgare]